MCSKLLIGIRMNKQQENIFLKTIEEKISVNPSPSFDKNFWSAFDKVSSINQSEKHSFFQSLLSKPMIPALSVSLVVLFSVLYINNYTPSINQSDSIAMEIIEMEQLLENMEILAEVEDINLTDEEWEILTGDS